MTKTRLGAYAVAGWYVDRDAKSRWFGFRTTDGDELKTYQMELPAKSRARVQHQGEARMDAKIEAILKAATDVIDDTEGPRTPGQARLALALYDYDQVRFGLGKDNCSCEDRDGCDECPTTAEALARCRRLASSDQQPVA